MDVHSTTGNTPAVAMHGVTKRFLDNVANDSIDFSVGVGEICALLGENGAGKTTLMNILFGYYGADEGTIEVYGEPRTFTSPREAIAAGIGMVHQHFALVPTHTVLENVVVGTGKGLFLDRAGARSRLEALKERFRLSVPSDAPVWQLSIGEQQKVEILKALYRDSRILIMDEPTAVLSPSETPQLFRTLRTLTSGGRSVIFISHKLHEVMEIADRVVVLRNGQKVHERSTSDTTVQDLSRMMVGHEVRSNRTEPWHTGGATVCRIDGLSVEDDKELPAVDDLVLELREGEILGLAGVSGNGQTELCDALFGMRLPSAGAVRVVDRHGTVRVLEPGRPYAAVAAGMARIPEDRMHTGLMTSLTVEQNLVLESHAAPPWNRHGLLDWAGIGTHAEELIGAYNIRTQSRRERAGSLSGGNLQKVILARELSTNPRLIVASQPTRGLDVGAMESIHARLREERARGAAILLISDDLDEILQLSDRVAVMYEGRIMGEQTGGGIDREQIGLWMSGVVQ